ALDAEQRAADGLRLSAEVLAHRAQVRLQVPEQRLERPAHMRVVVGLAGLEPSAIVVAGEAAQEAEALVGEVRGHGAAIVGVPATARRAAAGPSPAGGRAVPASHRPWHAPRAVRPAARRTGPGSARTGLNPRAGAAGGSRSSARAHRRT